MPLSKIRENRGDVKMCVQFHSIFPLEPSKMTYNDF